MKVDILYNYNIDDLLADDNKVGEILRQRARLATDTNSIINGQHITVAYNNRPFIWMRTPNIKTAYVEIKDDILWFHTPMRPSEVGQKEGSRFILHSETASVGYWYASRKISESIKMMDSGINSYEADLIVQNIVHGPYNALLNILKRKTDKSVEIINNDVTINGKKICGADEHYNESGTFIEMGINYFYDDDFFKKILSEDEYHRSTNQGITGISNEIPGYSKKDFTNDWIYELLRLTNKIKEA